MCVCVCVCAVQFSAVEDNRMLVDDGSSQALTDKDISELKEHGVTGKVRCGCVCVCLRACVLACGHARGTCARNS